MGVVPLEPTIYEVLEELAIMVQNQLTSRVPFCAFNGAWAGGVRRCAIVMGGGGVGVGAWGGVARCRDSLFCALSCGPLSAVVLGPALCSLRAECRRRRPGWCLSPSACLAQSLTAAARRSARCRGE